LRVKPHYGVQKSQGENNFAGKRHNLFFLPLAVSPGRAE